MNREFQLGTYLSNGIDRIVKGAVKATLKYPKESAFLARFALSVQKSKNLRDDAQARGEHVPPFLIASITSRCNLHCEGCYARANNTCTDIASTHSMDALQWGRIFGEASELGISFILLAGGEPLLRPDVLAEAAKYPQILFPVFTNGTLLEKYIDLFDKHRHLVPMLSIEGNEQMTDTRRGTGVYHVLISAMEKMKRRGILFGVSVTVTKENLHDATGSGFLNLLENQGCKVVVYVEFVPVDHRTKELAPGENERAYLKSRLDKLRLEDEGMVFISFPGDEKSSGGCLAAGRGFFHISVNGSAEPCPFSPYSDTSLQDTPLREALRSPLFMKLHEGNILIQNHDGGCVLYEQEDKVKELLG